jgi:transcription elongation factor Elf1
MRAKTNPLSSQTRIFECLCCGSDKFHACKENGHSFLSCVHCGLRTNILISDTCNVGEDKKKGDPI